MRTIVPPFEIFCKLSSPQKEKLDTSYRWNDLCLRVPCVDGTLLYNGMTGALYLLETGETFESRRAELIRTWCLLPQNYDERKFFRQLRLLAERLHTTRNTKSFTIVTTTDCNARCFYCYQFGCERKHMPPEVARDAAAYMARVSGDEELSITWFGGEPLYNRQAIEIISAELHRLGKPFHSLMITNGLYMDPATAIVAQRDWGVRNIQVTIDGTKELYERTKAFIDKDDSPYERVMANIGAAMDAGIQVLVRLNIDGNNANDLFRLAEDLGQRYGGRKSIHAYVFPLREYKGRIAAFSTEEEAEKCCLTLQDKLDELWPGYAQGLPAKMHGNCCMADNDAAELIMPDGGIEKCEHIQHREYLGSIYSSARDDEGIAAWKEKVYYSECDYCPLYTQCIILKKCDTTRFGCSKADRALKKQRLEKQILHTYREHIENGEKSHENG